MAIIGLWEEAWFQNLIWRLREHYHFERLDCVNRNSVAGIDNLIAYAENSMTGDTNLAVINAALQVDLLNNVDPDGGYGQIAKL